MLWDMLNEINDHVNAGSLPNYHEMFIRIINKEVSTNLDEARDIFNKEFVENLSEGEDQIDDLYHNAVNVIMKHFRTNLDPYLNVGDEIDQVFSEFVKVYNNHKSGDENQENLDYSESIDGSQILDQKSPMASKQDEDEFNINLLNSEFDRPRNSNHNSPKLFTPSKFDQSIKLTPASDLEHTVAKLKIALAEKDSKISELELKSEFKLSYPASSPKSEYLPVQEAEENAICFLKTQLKNAENELSKKAALFDQECKYWSEKSEKDKATIRTLRIEMQTQNDNYQHVIINKYEKEISVLQIQNEELNEKVQSLDSLLTKNIRETEKELTLRKNNELEYEVETKKKNYKIQELEQSLR